MTKANWARFTGLLAAVFAVVVASCSDSSEPGDSVGTSEFAAVPSGFVDDLIASGLERPTAMAFAPDGRLFVAQQPGQLRVISNANPPVLLSTPFLTVPVSSSGERGLLGVAFDPNFASNRFVYVYYTATTPAIHNRVSRFTASATNPNVAQSGSETIILELNNLSSATNHNGGAMHFGPDGRLYIAVGENANRNNAQTLSNLLGKMLRINPDGTIPSDNPSFTQAGQRQLTDGDHHHAGGQCHVRRWNDGRLQRYRYRPAGRHVACERVQLGNRVPSRHAHASVRDSERRHQWLRHDPRPRRSGDQCLVPLPSHCA